MAIQNPILFRGSRERLLRIIERSNGKRLPDKQFEIKMKDYSKKIPILTFSFRCCWEPTDDGIQISYTVLPTIPTLVISLLVFTFFAFPLFSAEPPTGGYFIIPVLLILVFLSQMQNCITAFRELFCTPTA